MTAIHPLISDLRTQLNDQRNGKDAAAMQAYMHDIQPFYGVKTPARRALLKRALPHHPIDNRADYAQIVRALWAGDFREERYLALDVAWQIKRYRDIESWPLYVELMHQSDWWDTLDWIAGKLMSPLVLEQRSREAELIAWRTDSSVWVRRASLLAHIKHKAQTNQMLLADTILILAPEDDFFIRKAIGWILREYAKSNPAWVSEFVTAHERELSALSRREALKNITDKHN